MTIYIKEFAILDSGMRKELRPGFLVLIVGMVVLLTVAFLQSNNIAVLNPKGIIADQQRSLIFTEVSIMLGVLIPLLLLFYFFAWRYCEGNKKVRYESEKKHSLAGELIWWVVPCIVVGVLAVINWKSAHALDPYKPITQGSVKPLIIEVVALNWKWLFIYPQQDIATVNFVEFPQQTPLDFELTADAPMNSFWIPQLGGQMYAMAGMSTGLHLMADGEGQYNGFATEINGQGYSGMKFLAKSTSGGDFNAWVASVKKMPLSLLLDEYDKLARPSENNPPAFYSSVENNLYNEIMMKFMAPSPTKQPKPKGTEQMPGMHM